MGKLLLDLTSALVVHVEEQAGLSRCSRTINFGDARSIKVAMHLCPLGETVFVQHLTECLLTDEVIILTVHLVRARLARCMRDTESEFGKLLKEAVCQRGFPGSRWRADHEENKI
jgi:hypothetical protein